MTNAQKAYREFLKTPFWQELLKSKKKLVGACERCGKKNRLQSHHKRYPKNWFDTTLDDLEVLCWICHAEEHGAVSMYGRPPAEEWLIDFCGRLFRKQACGYKLKRMQVNLLRSCGRKFRHDRALTHQIRNVFSMKHWMEMHA